MGKRKSKSRPSFWVVKRNEHEMCAKKCISSFDPGGKNCYNEHIAQERGVGNKTNKQNKLKGSDESGPSKAFRTTTMLRAHLQLNI